MTDKNLLAAVKARFQEGPAFRDELFRAIGEAAATTYFREGFQRPEDASHRHGGLGIWLAHACQWMGHPIAEVAHGAFEDANYHDVCEKLREHPDLGFDS